MIIVLAGVLLELLSVSRAHDRSTSAPELPISSTPIENRDWQPLVLLFFDANRTGADVSDGILGFFERYASCNLSRIVDVLLPHEDARRQVSCNSSECFREEFAFRREDVIAERGGNDTANITPRVLSRISSITSATPTKLRRAYVLLNVRCNGITVDYGTTDPLTDTFAAISAHNIATTVAFTMSEGDVNGCLWANAYHGVDVVPIENVRQLKNVIPENCFRVQLPSTKSPTQKAPKSTGTLKWIAVGASVTSLFALILAGFAVYRYRKRKEAMSNQRPDERSSTDPWLIEQSSLDILWDLKIGAGAFADVFGGRYRSRTGTGIIDSDTVSVAVKVLRCIDETNSRATWQEIELMKGLGSHDHIVALLGFSLIEQGPLIVLEYCVNGDLLRFLRQSDEQRAVTLSVRQEQLLAIAWQISDGMVFLSSRKYIHRDLAARNILLTSDLTAKISDFGLCRYTDEELYTAHSAVKLPYKWMAPESLRDVVFSTYTDVWSFGILLYEIFSGGSTPFADIETTADLLAYLDSGQRLKRPPDCSRVMYQLMTHCWQQQPKKRPSFGDIRLELAQHVA